MTDLKKYQPSAEQLEVGEVYEFSSDGETWFAEKFSYMIDGKYVMDSHWRYDYIRECQAPLGKIKPKPVGLAKLVDGEYYLFDKDGIEFIGQYYQGVFDGCHNAPQCTNIRRLKVVDDDNH